MARRYMGTVINASRRPQVGKTVQVLFSGTTNAAALFDQNGTPIANPVTTDANGQYAFNVRSGTYDLVDSTGQFLQVQVPIFDFLHPEEWPTAWTFANLTVLGLFDVARGLSPTC